MFVVAPALLGLALGASAHLDQGQEALRSLDYQRAESELQQARLEPGLSRTELLALLESYGAVEAILGNHEAAVSSFRELLNLDPAHVAPAKWAPKVRTPFFEAKSWQSEHVPLDLKEGAPVTLGDQVTLEFELTADTLHLARTLRVHVVGVPAPLDSTVPGPGKMKVNLPAKRAVQYWAEILDEHQAVLLATGDGAHPQHTLQANGDGSLGTGATVAPNDSGSDTLRTAGLVVGGGGVVLVAVGAVFGLKVRSDQSTVSNATRDGNGTVTSLTRAQAIKLDSEAKSDAVIADVLFAAGAVAAATGVGIWVGGTFILIGFTLYLPLPLPSGVPSFRWP